MTRLLKVVALVNARAGALEHQDAGTFRDRLISAFAESGVSADLEFLSGDRLQKGAEDATKKAARHEIDAVVVCGGDGSIRTVASVLTGTSVPLGILPLGTLNHFAKDLGIPSDIEGAVEVISAGRARAVDVAEVNGHVFINNSSVGIYPFLVLDRERKRRTEGRAKWVATGLAVLQMLWQFPLRRLSISTDGATESVRTSLLFVGNNKYDLALSSFGKRERLDEGELWLYVSKQQSRIALIWLACRSGFGLLDQARDLQILRVSSAEIRSRKRHLLVATDGEIETMRPPLVFRSRPGALHVLVPPEAEF